MTKIMVLFNFTSAEGGDDYTNQELRFHCKFLKWFFWMKRGLAAVLVCSFVCLGHPGEF